MSSAVVDGARHEGAADEPPSLDSFPDSLLFVLCGLLEDSACLSLRATSVALRASLRGADADLGVWKPRVVALVPAAACSCSSYEQALAFLRSHEDLIGDYIWPLPVIGGAVRVRLLSAERLVATLTLRPRVRAGAEYSTLPLFDITRGAGGDGAAVVTVSPQLGSSDWTVRRQHGRHGRALRLSCRVPSPLRAPLSFLRAVSQLPGSARIACDPLGAGTGPVGDALGPSVLPYLYGSYGPHGTELLHMSWGPLWPAPSAPPPLRAAAQRGDGPGLGLRGVKVCGDPNVPSGRCSFSGYGEIVPASRIDEIEPTACRCMFMCECIQAREVEHGEVTLLGAMAAAARTARHGYRGPEDHSAKLVFYRRKAVAPLPPEMRRVGTAAPEGAVHVLLIWDGPDFRSSSRLAPILLHSPSDDAGAAATAPFDVTHGLEVEHGEGIDEEEEDPTPGFPWAVE